jgi:DNA-binding NtrC family response regulator
VAVNCGAIPEGLLESELFGHAKGAFSGAEKDRAGLIERADGGTLFLDEVGELPPAAQVKLLRVLAERAVTRVGEAEGRPVDFRLVAATLQDLPSKVEDGSFREDLYYRLHVVALALPALRERAEDLPGIVDFLLVDLVDRLGVPAPTLAPDFLPALAARPWPGNVRQLRNALERALVLCEDETLTAADLPPVPAGARGPAAAPVAPPTSAGPVDAAPRPVRPYRDELTDFERDYFRRLKDEVGDNVSAMSRVAGIARLTLYRRLGKLALDGD